MLPTRRSDRIIGDAFITQQDANLTGEAQLSRLERENCRSVELAPAAKGEESSSGDSQLAVQKSAAVG